MADSAKESSQDSAEISPISATPSPTSARSLTFSTSGSKKTGSNLPLPRNNTKKFWKLPVGGKGTPGHESAAVRWDEYSGEPTAGEKGKPPSATPGSVRLRETPNSLTSRPEFGTSTHITGGLAPRKRVGGREVTEAPITERPEWKAAGGRQAIVRPISDNLSPHGLEISSPVSASAQRHVDATSPVEGSLEHADPSTSPLVSMAINQESEVKTQKEKERGRMQRMVRERIDKARRERERIHQAKGESDRRVKQRSEKTSSLTSNPSSEAAQSPKSPESADVQSPSMSPLNSHPSISPPPVTTPSNQAQDAALAALTQKSGADGAREGSDESSSDRIRAGQYKHNREALVQEPPFPERVSSLSETQATEGAIQNSMSNSTFQSEAGSDSRQASLAASNINSTPPMTPERDVNGSPSSDQSHSQSILNRRRPVPALSNVKRKGLPGEVGAASNGLQRGESKLLPKPPADAPIIDPVQALQAKQDVLRRRRFNLETVITELTNVVQPSSIQYDLASRAEIKKTVATLEKELSEIVKEEHDTGLKLHRAYKRHDAKAPYEPTSIWVRRVTN